MKLATFIIALLVTTMTYAAELLQQSNECDSQLKSENCVNNYCVVSSVISEEPNCEQICMKCAEEACSQVETPSDECINLSL
ncbi:hypothetical protein [Legionella sp. W05-934-2]|jgi:hypothetical protein|uniref:hypothetical protein n=1 Tax=Legionella sp. W05-934-2 TaxID=1198649 RepID=UPI0034621A63